MVESNFAHQAIAIHASKDYDPDQQYRDLLEAINAPIDGITGEDRLEELEGESWAAAFGVLGQ